MFSLQCYLAFVSWLHVLSMTFFPFNGCTCHLLLFTAKYKKEGDTRAKRNGNEAGIFYAELLYLAPQCQGSPVMKEPGVSRVLSPIEMSVFGFRKKTLAGVSVGLSSSSLPVGQKDRDGSLSAGL